VKCFLLVILFLFPTWSLNSFAQGDDDTGMAGEAESIESFEEGSNSEAISSDLETDSVDERPADAVPDVAEDIGVGEEAESIESFEEGSNSEAVSSDLEVETDSLDEQPVTGVPGVTASDVVVPDVAEEPKPEAAPSEVETADNPAPTVVESESPKIFGTHRLHLGVVYPKFDNSNEYKLVYGEPSVGPALGVDYFFFDWFATLGLGFRMSYLTDRGKALIIRDGVITKDAAGKVELTVVPLQLLGIFEATPFTAKWLVLSGWVGFEWAYFQEVRSDDDDSETEDKDTTKLTNSGWRKATVFGVGVSFLLDWLDSKSVSSMAIMGIKSVYLTPYIEVVKETGSEPFDFSRSILGGAFTFETF